MSEQIIKLYQVSWNSSEDNTSEKMQSKEDDKIAQAIRDQEAVFL